MMSLSIILGNNYLGKLEKFLIMSIFETNKFIIFFSKKSRYYLHLFLLLRAF